jgi:Tfp pilus assembly protein PilO
LNKKGTDEVRKLTKRETTLLIVFLLMIAIVVVEYWLVPALKSRQELKARRLQLTQQWEDIAFYLGREDEMKKRIGTLQAERDKLQRKLPAHQYSYLYWETILETAKESGVTISQIQEGNVSSVCENVRLTVL